MARALPVVLADDPVERLACLFDVHNDRLYPLARRRLAPGTDDAFDLVQETFLKAARFPKSIPVGTANEEAWLERVLINIRRDQWRKTSVRDRHDKAEPRESHLASGSRDPEVASIARSAVAARVIQGNSPSQYSIHVEFKASGAQKMRAATGNHIGKPVAILLDGQVVMAPVLRSPIDAPAVVTSNFTRTQAERIVNGIGIQ